MDLVLAHHLHCPTSYWQRGDLLMIDIFLLFDVVLHMDISRYYDELCAPFIQEFVVPELATRASSTGNPCIQHGYLVLVELFRLTFHNSDSFKSA